MKKLNLFLRVFMALILLFFSVYGFIPEHKNVLNTKNSLSKQFTKSDYFLNTKTPLVIYLKGEDKDKNVLKNVQQLCDYTKIPFASIHHKELNTNTFQLPSSLKTILISNTKKLSNDAIKKLLNFTAQGGSLIITNLIEDDRFNYFIGLDKKKSKHKYNIKASGIIFNNNFIPNLNTISIYEDYTHYGYDKQSFNSNVKTILTATTDNDYPVITQNKLGLGNVWFYNTSLRITKNERGLLFPTMLISLEKVPYPVANISTIFLDDFPSPVYPFLKEPIKSEYNISSQKFVKDIWWPDMAKLAKKYNIKYTTTIIFDYEENTKPPFSYKQWNFARENFVPIPHSITKDVLNQNHELGFHGYNHVSLLKKSWSKDNLKIALNTVKNMWKINNYKTLPVSYIPPSNYIDKLGITSLNRGLPSVKYMCSLYTGKFIKGGGREFNPEPYTHTMFDFPRITSGFYLNSLKKYLKESVYLYTGIWSHFVHPDDVYQVPDKSNLKSKGEFSYRNDKELNWKKTNAQNIPGMYYMFENILKKHIENYPFTTFPDVKKGGKLVAVIRNNNYQHNQSASFYSVENITKNTLQNQYNWFLYITQNKANKLFNYLSKEKLSYAKTPISNGYLVNIKSSKPSLKIPIETNSSPYQNIAHIYNEYENHTNYKETTKEILDKKLIQLKKELFNTKNTFSLDLWKEYAKYSSWAKLEKEFWKDLEQYYYLKQNYKAASLPNEMSKIIWYPTNQSKRIWLERQILTATNIPTKLNLLQEYIKNYNSVKNRNEIQKKLKLIAEINPNSENKKAYITSYLWNNDTEKEAILNSIPIENDYQIIAKELAWYFYQNKQLQKALEWAILSKEIPVETQLYWIYQAKKPNLLSQYYNNYPYASEKEKTLASKTMVNLLLAQKKFKQAWFIAKDTPKNSNEYNEIRQQLNTYFLYQNRKIQKTIMANKSTLLYKKIRDSIARIIMLEQNNSYVVNSSINTFKEEVATLDKTFTYNTVSKNNNVHSFSFNQSSVNNIINKDEKNVNLYGINYQFKNTNEFNKKYRYSGNFGLATFQNKYLYQLGFQGSYNLENSLYSLSYSVAPVKTAISTHKHLYKNTLGFYFEKNFKNKFNLTSYLEGNYYTDYQSDLTVSISTNYPIYTFNNNVFRAAIENANIYGSTNKNGLPYWMITNRYYLGTGLQYQLNTDINKTYIFLDGMYFYDSYAIRFSRFRATCSLQLQKYLNLNFNGELYLNNLYYSNSFTVGLNYYLK